MIGEQVALVRFDDSTPPTVNPLAKRERDVTAAFSNDGTRFAYALSDRVGAWTAHAVTAPDGQPFDAEWAVPGLSAELTWVGNDTILAEASGSESSHLLQLGDSSVADLGSLGRVRTSVDQSTAIAGAGGRVLLLEAGMSAQSSVAVPGFWDAFVSGDGRGLALFSDRAIPDLGLSIPTTSVQWSAPASEPCQFSPQPPQRCVDLPKYALGEVEWQNADSPIIAEFDATVLLSGTRMALATIDPQATTHLTAPEGVLPQLWRNWGLLRDGNTFLIENADDPLTQPWRARLGAASYSASGVLWSIGFAQYAVASGDESALFVLNFSKATSTTTVYALTFPLSSETTLRPLFSATEKVGVLWPEPNGPGLVVGTGGGIPGQTCEPGSAADCATIVYYLSDGQANAVPLPAGLSQVQWTPDGEGVVGILGDSVVYIAKAAPDKPMRLATGGAFVLPAHW